MGKIQIEGMEFYAYHGCFQEEQVVGNKFLVDVAIETNTEQAQKTDSLHDTVNYQVVYNLVKEEMQVKAKLLENVAGRIIVNIHSHFPEIISVEVKVSKMNPPMGGKIDKVSVTLKKEFAN